MRLKNILFVSFLILAGFSVNPMSATINNANNTNFETILDVNDDIIIHTVKKGENVYSISEMYNVSTNEIYELNPNSENGIKEGQKLKVPKALKPTGYSNHVIEAKETLFSVAKMYRIKVADIKRANTGLNEDNFNIGKTIRIPKFNPLSEVISSNKTIGNTVIDERGAEYKVRKGDTLYSIGKAHDATVEALINANPSLKNGGLKDGMTITIPTNSTPANNTSVQYYDTVIVDQQNPGSTSAPYASKGDVVKVGILLPFLDTKGSVPQQKLIEYYEGFLLAVKEMKQKGLNAEIYSFDIGSAHNTEKLKSLLETNEMKSLHLVIGGVSKEQIHMLTDFSKETGIRYAIPFGSINNNESTTSVFQMTSSHTSLYPEIISAFKDRFSDYNIIFVNDAGSKKNDKEDFVADLKKALSAANISFKSTGTTGGLYNDITGTLSSTKTNLLIPATSSEATLRRMLTAIGSIKGHSISLFGYPEWQTYSQHTASLHKYNSFIYSIFFVDDKQQGVKDVFEEYKKWYTRNMVNSYPKYGLLGYDVGLYFLTALNKYGSDLEPHTQSIKVPTLQSAIRFEYDEKNNLFVNRGLYFINYKPDSSIEKINVSN